MDAQIAGARNRMAAPGQEHHAAEAAAGQQVAQAEHRCREVCEKLEAAAVEREELRGLERQAMCRAQELSDSLLESRAKIQVPAVSSPCGTST